MSRSFLEVEGIYLPGKRYAFTNITDEDFTSHWAKVPIVIKAHETIEVSDITPIPGSSMGQNLAIKMTIELTDKIIIGNAKMDEVAKNQPYYRSPIASNLGIPNYRKQFEDQILRELEADEDSPAMQYMREKLKQEILSGNSQEASREDVLKSVPNVNLKAGNIDGFSEITKKNETIEEVKKPAKTKKVKVPKNETIKSTGTK